MKTRVTGKWLLLSMLLIAPGTIAEATPIPQDQLLGTIVPGTPSDPDNEIEMVSFLVNELNSRYGKPGGPVAYNGAGVPLGDNPNDTKKEFYTLWAPNDLSIPAPTPVDTNGQTQTGNPTINLGLFQYDYLLAKFGPNSEVFWIGNLSGEITVPNLLGNNNEISNYILVNKHAVPDGGMTALLLGIGLASVLLAGRRFTSM